MEKSSLICKLPPMLSGDTLNEAMKVLPDYRHEVIQESAANRLMALSDMYSVFVPNQMSREIYSKLYLALLRSFQKKEDILRIRQGNENYKAIMKQSCSGIIGGADSFTIIGESGIGKSSAISQAIRLITDNQIITMEEPYTKIVPCVLVQCPFDSSVKGLLLEIIRVVDEQLGSNYYPKATSIRATTDMLIGTVAQIALNHIGILIVDEIQNVALSRNGRNLLGVLLQLINCSGISIAMVGTPECTDFFTQVMQIARRSLGLYYQAMDYGKNFQNVCEILFRYQYINDGIALNESVMRWLYEHSGGNVAAVVSLLHDAQELAILDGSEKMTMETLRTAYQNRMGMLHSFITPTRKAQTSVMKKTESMNLPQNNESSDFASIGKRIQQAKNEGRDIVTFIKAYIPLEEVKV